MMEKKYEVKITSHALRQMQEIVRYISSILHSPKAAEQWLVRVEKDISSLSHMPARIGLTEEEPWRTQGVHRMVVGNFLVYFWIDEDSLRVWVTAFVYGRRDKRQQLEEIG